MRAPVTFALFVFAACRRDAPPRPPIADAAAAVTAPPQRDAEAPPCPPSDLARCRTLALEAIERRDDARAVLLARFGCEGGHLPACRTLAWLAETGRGGLRDLSRARALYRRACDGGELESCKSLGFLYDTAVNPDRAEAARLYTRACDGGIVEACNNLANLFLGGDGVPRDPDRAIALYDRVCATGRHERACGNARALRASRDAGAATRDR